MSYFTNHMFICTNKRDGKPSCGAHEASEVVTYAKEQAAELGLTKACKFRISSSGCLGRCKEGPLLAVYPSGAWYKYNNKEEVAAILSQIADGQKLLGNI